MRSIIAGMLSFLLVFGQGARLHGEDDENNLLNAISRRAGISHGEAHRWVSHVTAAIMEETAKGVPVQIDEFGSFKVVPYRKRSKKVMNGKTSVAQISFSPRFKADDAFRKRVAKFGKFSVKIK